MIKVTVIQDGEPMGTGAYHSESILVGRGQGADLQVDEEGVLDEHCEIVVIDHKLYVRPVEDAPIWVDDKQVGTSVLTTESLFRVGGDLAFRATYRRPSTSGRFERIGAVSFRNAPDQNAPTPAPGSQEEPEPKTPSATSTPSGAPTVDPALVAKRVQQQQRAEQLRLIAMTAGVSVALTALASLVYFGL